MSMFGKSAVTGVIDLEESTIYDGVYEPTLEGAYLIVAEGEQNWTRLMEAQGIEELDYIETHGEEMPYTEGADGGFFAKAKEWFLNIWEKVKALFKRFFSMFDSLIKSDKEFISKYEKDLLKVTGTDKFKYKGFKFTFPGEGGNKVNIDGDAYSKQKSEVLMKNTEDFDLEELKEKIRGSVIGDNGSYSASEFSKELFSTFRGGESAKEEIEGIRVTDIISQLKGSAKKKTDAEKAMKGIKRGIDDAIKATEKAQKENVNGSVKTGADNSDKISRQTNSINLHRAGLEIIQIANGALLSAIKAYSSQNKGICSKLLTFKAAKEGFGDYEGSSYNEGSAVSALKFI